jgi:hypothetical protein
MANDLKVGQNVIVNIPFVYTIGEEGVYTNKVLKTIQDCKDEVVAEIENGVLSDGSNIFMEVNILTSTVEKKDEIEKIFINQIARFGIDLPENWEEIVQFIYEDVCETADPINWNDDDVRIGFRRWIESKI